MFISTTTLTSSPSDLTAVGQKQEACSSIGLLARQSPSDRPLTTPSSTTLSMAIRQPNWSEADTLFADIEAAEAHYVERCRALLLQREGGWSRFCRYFPALWSAKERAAWNADEFLRKSPPVSAEDEANRFNDARDAGATLARRGGRRAATWLVQAWIARLMEDDEPCTAIKEAARAYHGAQVSRSLAPGRRLVVAAAGQTVLLPVGREATAAVSKPLLAWPGDLGAEFPVHIDAPVDFAAQCHADEIEY